MNTLQDGDAVEYYEITDECPVHGGTVKREYTFGRYQDATVYTYTNCSCAGCLHADPYKLGEDSATYHTSWRSAQSKAQYAKQVNTAANR